MALAWAVLAGALLLQGGAPQGPALAAAALLAVFLVFVAGSARAEVRALQQQAQDSAERVAELQRLALVAEHTSALVVIAGFDGRALWVNAAFTTTTGWSAEAVLGQASEVWLGRLADDAGLPRRLRAMQARGALGMREPCRSQARDGRDLWLELDLRPLRDGLGAATGFICVGADITARMQQQAKLQTLWAAMPAGVVVQSVDGSIVDANGAAEQLLGLSLAQMQGRDSTDPRWRAVRDDGSPYPGHEHPSMRTLASGEPLRNETMGIHLPGGELRWLLVNTEPQRDSQGQLNGVVSCFSDITESRALQARLSESSRIDALTRLPNRSVVMERLHRVIAHARRHPGYGFAVLFMDFDRFKQVNDTLGHGAGDELLRQIASRLVQALRPGDAVGRLDAQEPVAARLGGDEFVLVLEGVRDAQAVAMIAQRLLKDLAEPYLIEGAPVHSSASIGVVLCIDLAAGDPAVPGPAAEDVLRDADTAMYEAKRAGRGRWVMFDASMHERLVKALALETDLRQALQGDGLSVAYQPVIDLATRAITGVEALVRWKHPVRGLVPPSEFIPVAEEAGLIEAVGAVVLRRACAQFMAWGASAGAAAPRQLAVNLSRAQLERQGLVEDVAAVLRQTGMRPEQLQLEVTESLAARDERALARLRELKGLGVRLALDDFGTGYSSLACLHLMPVDTVKIDRSFVQHAPNIEYHRVLIEATIRVARTLGMSTVAEGIETEAQAALMLALDCDRGQGYLFSRPLDADALAAWAIEHEAAAAASCVS
jgi:diguanylate cyclase (GGDEF)-like protein/PAS domain S-box-containing protein